MNSHEDNETATKHPMWQLSTVPVILTLQNVKQALLTTTTAASGDVTRSVLLTIASDSEKAEKGTQACDKASDADRSSSYSPPPVPVDRSKVNIQAAQARTITNVRTVQQFQQIRSPQNVAVVRPVSQLPFLRRMPAISTVRGVVPQNSLLWSSSEMSVVRPLVTGVKNVSLTKEGEATKESSVIDMSSRPVSMEIPISNVMVKNDLQVNQVQNHPHLLKTSPTNDSSLGDDDVDEVKSELFEEPKQYEESKPSVSTVSEYKDYRTTPLKKRPLIIPSEGYSSMASDSPVEADQIKSSVSKPEIRKKTIRSRPSRRKPKNMDIKIAERFVMVNRGVLEGLMDHVKSNAEPLEERELARRFQKDRIKKCDYCDRTFNYFSKLVEHIRSHTKIKPYVCRICESRFKYKGDLMVHIKQHSEDKPFSCDCGRQFATKKYLNVHKRQAAIMGRHPAARPFSRRQDTNKPSSSRGTRSSGRRNSESCDYWLFECQECGKRLTSKLDLMDHVRTHTSMEPVFECDTCAIKFEDPQLFENHMLEHN